MAFDTQVARLLRYQGIHPGAVRVVTGKTFTGRNRRMRTLGCDILGVMTRFAKSVGVVDQRERLVSVPCFVAGIAVAAHDWIMDALNVEFLRD